MSASKRRKVSDAESSSENEQSLTHRNKEVVQIDFEGRAPLVTDKSGISQLLNRLYLKAPINTLEMANVIVAQNYVGSVIHQPESDLEEGDVDDVCEHDSIFGITTTINISEKKDVPCIKQLRTYILENAEKNANKTLFNEIQDILADDSKQVGYIINERFINIPAPIAAPMFENLYKELQKAIQNHKKFKFDYYLMIIKLYRKEGKKDKSMEDLYTNPEEEVILSKALNSFEFNVTSECGTGIGGNWDEDDQPLIPYRKVLLLDGKDLPNIISEIRNVLGSEGN